MAKEKAADADGGKGLAVNGGAAVAESPEEQAQALALYEQHSGGGFENQTSDDYSIPFLGVLQAISPQLVDNDQLKQGMIYNTVTGDAFPGGKGVVFIPATTQHQYVEFKPREAGGGFVGVYDLDDPVVKAAIAESTEYGKYSTAAGNELIETFYVYGIAVMEDGSTMSVVIGFTSSKIKKYKAWMTKAKTIQIALPDGRRIPAPLFSHRYRLKTVSEKNAKGTFYNWDIAFDGLNALEARLKPTDPLFTQALDIKALLDSGKARAAHESVNAGDSEQSGASGEKPVF